MPELKCLLYPKWGKDHINGFKQNVRLAEQTGKILQSRKLGLNTEMFFRHRFIRGYIKGGRKKTKAA